MKKLFIDQKEFALTNEMKEDIKKYFPQFVKGRPLLFIPEGQIDTNDVVTGAARYDVARHINTHNTVAFDGKRIVPSALSEGANLVEIRISERSRRDPVTKEIRFEDTLVSGFPNMEISYADDPVLAYFLLFGSGQIKGNKCPEAFRTSYTGFELVDDSIQADLFNNRMTKVSKAVVKLYEVAETDEELIKDAGKHFNVPRYDIIPASEIVAIIVRQVNDDGTSATADHVLEFLNKSNEFIVTDTVSRWITEGKIAIDESDMHWKVVKDGAFSNKIMPLENVDPTLAKAALISYFESNSSKMKWYLNQLK